MIDREFIITIIPNNYRCVNVQMIHISTGTFSMGEVQKSEFIKVTTMDSIFLANSRRKNVGLRFASRGEGIPEFPIMYINCSLSIFGSSKRKFQRNFYHNKTER